MATTNTNVELQIKLDQAVLALKLAIHNKQQEQTIKEAWIKMSMTSSQKKTRGGNQYDKNTYRMDLESI